MFLLNLFQKPKNEKVILMLELGSGSVSGALAKIGGKSKPVIFYSVREQITFQENLQTDRVLPLMLTTLDKICLKVQKDGLVNIPKEITKRSIDEIHFILSSPWTISQTKIAALNFEKPTVITNGLISKIIEEQEKNAEVSAKAFFETLHEVEDDLVFEKKTIQIKLNGYKVNDVIGKSANRIDLAILISITSKVIMNQIKEVVNKYFLAEKNDTHSFTMSSLSVIRDIVQPERKGYTILDLSSEITDLALVRDEIMSGGISFPIGRNHFVRRVSKDLNISIEEAFAALATYHSKNLDKIYELKIENSLAVAMLEWSAKLKESLEILSKKAYIPRTIIKITNDDFGRFFANNLQKETFSQIGFSQEPFNVIMLEKEEMMKYCEVSSATTSDVFMMVNAIYLNKIF
jgi:hypothetical protein